ncbi:hypothetical protein QJQ45_005828 [Haematococcus lacustris]|nr:hypothetical protein QJQ45_005828 [Haematococcus lacustris]
MACGYGIDAKSSELQAGNLDKGHVADLIGPQAAFTSQPALSHHWARWFNTRKLANKGSQFERIVETDIVSVCVHYTRPLPPPPAPPPAASSSSSGSAAAAAVQQRHPSAAAAAAHAAAHAAVHQQQRQCSSSGSAAAAPKCSSSSGPCTTQIGVGIDPGITQAVSAASDQESGQLVADQLDRWKLTKGQLKHASGHLQHLAAASSAGTSLVVNVKHITVTLAAWDAVWAVYLDPKWARQRLRLYGAQDRALEQFFKQLEKDMADVSMERHGRGKQLVVFFGAANIGTRGGWGADTVLRACCKVVCRPRGSNQLRGRVVLVDEHRTTRVSSAVNGQQPCEEELDHEQPTRRAALNMQRIGESRWRPLERCYWPEQGALPAKGKEYPGLGYKQLRGKPPKAQQQQQQQQQQPPVAQ